MFARSSLIVLLIANIAFARTVENAAHKADENERIVGGKDAEAGQFPWSVALYYNNQFICTASIISPTTVLTAAHCVILSGQEQPPELFHGIANVKKSAEQVRIDFATVTSHPDYDDQQIDNDIALFTTTEPIEFDSTYVGPVCLAREDTDQMEYENATAMGWGNILRYRFLPPVTPDNLQYAEQKIVENERCALINPGINEKKICAKGPAWEGICNGDSGGPLVHLSAEKVPVQIGVASYINEAVGCGKFAPGVWTRVSSHIDFIMQNAADAAICTL